jgi:hypothetical protein
MGYKSRLKKQRKRVRLMNKYREHPDTFCEEMFGVKLFDYQKKILSKLWNNE